MWKYRETVLAIQSPYCALFKVPGYTPFVLYWSRFWKLKIRHEKDPQKQNLSRIAIVRIKIVIKKNVIAITRNQQH